MRLSGILMPVFSLPSDYGIGSLGKEAFRFIDFLKKAGQSYWQILPLNPTNYGNSPYQSFSSFAGNPYLIDLESLTAEGLLRSSDYKNINWGKNPEKIDYDAILKHRDNVLRCAFKSFRGGEKYEEFKKENADWLVPYTLFMALKNKYGDISFREWPKEIVLKEKKAIEEIKNELSYDIEYFTFQQFIFYRQWESVLSYAGKNGIKIIGDMPIYVSADSADVWWEPENFQLNKDLTPTAVAGVPPDAFCLDGQKWGMPLYDWDYMEKEEKPFSFWVRRMKNALKLYDVVRIDHFRACEAYFSIEPDEKTAKNGVWKKGPGMKLFDALKKNLGTLPIIAEDLGFLNDGVKKLLNDTGFPGMKVLQFAFDGEDNDYLPHNYTKNSVVYTGTHDNDTVLGWAKNASENELKIARDYMCSSSDIHWAMIKEALKSVSDTAILMMADIIGLDSVGRINTPSTVRGNWEWRIRHECINDWLASVIYENTEIYKRLPKNLTKTMEI